jgi:hypothetical protein
MIQTAAMIETSRMGLDLHVPLRRQFSAIFRNEDGCSDDLSRAASLLAAQIPHSDLSAKRRIDRGKCKIA